MNPRFLGQFIILLLVVSQASFAAIRYVSKEPDAPYSSITAAMTAALEGDEIIITDFATYKEQVTINKNRITLKSQNPSLAKKPIIEWQDKANDGPKTWDEAKDTTEKYVTFDQNGAVRVMRAQGVKIEGIIMDGGGPYAFANKNVWDGKFALLHGNSALVLLVAGDVVIRNCELRNAYFGVYVKDRNEGGIFAKSNPADVAKWRVVPLSGFAKTGNHLFEYNKIHNNSWGTFFESTWDLGSTIRYNLIYENHHQTTAFATMVKGLDSQEGGNQPGGAMLFKDILLSPLAIYNNTFWHNHTIFCAGWQAGAQHLIFNNIYAEPYVYWNKNPVYTSPFMEYSTSFVNRMKNCLFACQEQAPSTQSQEYQHNMTDPTTGQNVEGRTKFTGISQVRIMNGMDKVEVQGEDVPVTVHLEAGDTIVYKNANFVIQPGALITVPYPKDANMRWLEPKFQSIDPTDPRFLTPDWDNPVMKGLIVDKGWLQAGIRDADGSIADIGAISFVKRQETVVMIKPTEPVLISGTVATATFNLSIASGKINNPVIQYVKWIDGIKHQADIFGPQGLKLALNKNIVNVTPSISQVTVGVNRFTFTVPARTDSLPFAFLEIVVRGTDENGDSVTSDVGFLPYRALSYKFLVKIFGKDDKIQKTELKEVRAGDTVIMKVLPLDSSGRVIPSVIEDAVATLSSNSSLLGTDFKEFKFTPQFTKADSTHLVVFTKVPPNGALEYVSVSGYFQSSAAKQLPIRGSTLEGIKILPGPADHVLFFDPPSKGVKVVNPGANTPILAKVYDKFDNLVDKTNPGEKTVTLKSLHTDKGDVVDPANQTIDDTGSVHFNVKVTGGDLKDTFYIVATLPVVGKSDTAKCVIGKPRDQFFIFYSDTVGGYVESAKIEGVCGDRIPVTIIASVNGQDIITTRDTRFDIDFPSNAGVLNAYLNPTDSLPITQYQLTSGKAKIWITSTGNSISNGEIAIYSSTDATITKKSRLNIFFSAPQYRVKSGAYYADNGNGQVNRLEIYYEDTLKSAANLPDSLELYWPRKADASKIIVKNKFAITLDPADNKHVTVKLDTPFDTSITANSGGSTQLGTVYWRNPATPAAPVQVVKFNIADSVGPLLSSAVIVERIGSGDDTLYITFTESVPVASIQGSSLRVIKNNLADTFDLDVKSAVDTGSNVIRIVVANAAANSPAAGDLLKIKAAGTISDQFNNNAQPANRPVKIKIKQIPASVISASYYDKNADGIVDTLTIQFNKNVASEYFKVTAIWHGNSTKDISGAGIGGAAMELIVKLDGAFSNPPVDITSGALDIKVSNTEFPGVTPYVAVDKAAPVLISADYYPGKALSITQNEPDILKVVFSEGATVASDPEPFVFKDKSSSPYSVALVTPELRRSADSIWYTVKDVSKFPVNGDLVNIKVGKVSDKLNNFQDKENNKRVVLKVHQVEYKLSSKLGPNPFKADGVQKITLAVVPLTKMKESLKLNAQLKIYDEMGSLVMDTVVNNSSDTIKFVWNGTNKKGRLVGAGTYVGILSAKDLNPDNSVKLEAPPRFLIGVKR